MKLLDTDDIPKKKEKKLILKTINRQQKGCKKLKISLSLVTNPLHCQCKQIQCSIFTKLNGIELSFRKLTYLLICTINLVTLLV